MFRSIFCRSDGGWGKADGKKTKEEVSFRNEARGSGRQLQDGHHPSWPLFVCILLFRPDLTQLSRMASGVLSPYCPRLPRTGITGVTWLRNSNLKAEESRGFPLCL